MRIPVVLTALLAIAAAPANAQIQPTVEVQAKRPLPAGKYAVDLASDSALGRDIRRLVMEKLAARGHQVGFSGGHVMKLQVDLTRHFAGGPSADSVLTPPRSQIGQAGPRGEDRPLPDRRVSDLEPRASVSVEMLRLTLTLRTAGSGEATWVAFAACPVREGRALAAGRSMVDAIFANPNRSRRGEVDCPA